MGLRQKKSLIDQASDYVETVRPQFESAVESAVGAAREAAKEAREKAGPAFAEAREKAAPYLADAREKAGPAFAEARAKAAPYLADAAALATEKAALGADYAAEKAALGRDLAASKVAQLKGEPEPKKKGKLRKILLLGGLAAGLGVVARKLTASGSADNWQSSYVPAPAPAAPPTTPAAPMAGTHAAASEADTGGSSPDEVIADEAESAHPVTTPDDPAEVIAIDEEPSDKL